MKKKNITMIFMILMVIVLVSCSQKDSSQEAKDDMHRMQKQHDKKEDLYQCPMHPEYTSDKEGQCPICGMNLVRIEKGGKSDRENSIKENSMKETMPSQQEHPTDKKKDSDENQIYQCPMHPEYTSDKPGQCPICGMNLVRIDKKEEVTKKQTKMHDRTSIQISPRKQQAIGVKIATVKRDHLKKIIKATGIVDYVEPKLAYINIKFEGWAERLYVDYQGKYVNKGQKLIDIYSPELVSTQQEYLLAYKYGNSLYKDSTSKYLSILDVVKERFKLWDISDQEIKRLQLAGEVSRLITLYSPVNGFVIEKNVIQGQKIMPGENLYKIADISTIWIYGDIYERDLKWVKLNQPVQISLSYIPDEVFDGVISYIYPYLNESTRTNRIRVEVKNREFKLKPDMYANIELKVDLGEKLAIPSEAVLDTGEHRYVFLDKGDGYFEPVEVKLGTYADEYYEVIDGLTEGNKIVSSATFLIDSESSIRAAIEQISMTEHKH